MIKLFIFDDLGSFLDIGGGFLKIVLVFSLKHFFQDQDPSTLYQKPRSSVLFVDTYFIFSPTPSNNINIAHFLKSRHFLLKIKYSLKKHPHSQKIKKHTYTTLSLLNTLLPTLFQTLQQNP